MDAIKKKMEKLSNETASAEARIAHFEDIKAANELEAEKFEEQLRNIQKKMQVIITSVIINFMTLITIIIIKCSICSTSPCRLWRAPSTFAQRTSSTRRSSWRRWKKRQATLRGRFPHLGFILQHPNF